MIGKCQILNTFEKQFDVSIIDLKCTLMFLIHACIPETNYPALFNASFSKYKISDTKTYSVYNGYFQMYP